MTATPSGGVVEPGDARYGEVVSFPSAAELRRRMPPLGYLLGGHVGVGTVLLAFTIGPVTHAGLRRFHLTVREDAPEVLGE